MTTGVQFTGTLPAGATQTWFTFNWAASQQVAWYIMPTSIQAAKELSWSVATQRSDATHCTYWITVSNLTSTPVTFEGRYAVLG